MPNKLINEKSPYLYQHAHNPVNWYPWCDEALEKAKKEDKPIFLSIGYSTCHWCHVMAHESFEDQQVADILNKHFVSIKVDKEERPDIDSVYMAVCQVMTGSGGWPLSIFMTPEQKPFFAGTYFPKETRYGMIGFVDLVKTVEKKWRTDRQPLLDSTDKVVEAVQTTSNGAQRIDDRILEEAVQLYKNTFDPENGGFGNAPKFPVPHNLLFLLEYFEKKGEPNTLHMAEVTLMQMYRGGIFDHIGFGFSRYSTDSYFLVPHFEKMLYDNVLLIEAYCNAYAVTQKEIYKTIAEKTANYLLREMQDLRGGFYCAQDADSEGVEGRYYVLKPEETIRLLGEKIGKDFNLHYDITDSGNFEGWNIPNLLQSKEDDSFSSVRNKLYEYRKNRHELHLDDKMLTSWNGMAMNAFATLYRISGNQIYLEAAQGIDYFIQQNLIADDVIYASFVKGHRGNRGLLDDYAFYIGGLIALYEATGEKSYLNSGETYCQRAIELFYDKKDGGFFLYGEENEQLIVKPKEIYDGAIPSGNSVMAYNLVRIYLLTDNQKYKAVVEKQLAFMCGGAAQYPAGYSYFLRALLMYVEPPEKIVIVLGEGDSKEKILTSISLTAIVTVLEMPTSEYPLLNSQTTYYVCKGHTCLPPRN